MSFLNLTLPELLAVFTAITAVVVTLYMLDRVRRRHVVSSLRFFNVVGQSPETQHRRRIQQPLSLLLQLASLTLLLLAAAEVRCGPGPESGRDHVLVLDTSAWMSAASPRSSAARPLTLIEETRAAARRWLDELPANDRVLLVRADSVPTPATAFETDRTALSRAIDESQPGAAVLSVSGALQFAEQARSQTGSSGGEIVFAGAARTLPDEVPPADNARSLRMLRVVRPSEHCGLRRVGVRRSPADPDLWEILVSARNYGPAPKNVLVQAAFNGTAIGTTRLTLLPASDQNAAFTLRTRSAGALSVHLTPDDVFPPDHQAELELPARDFAEVAVYTDQPDLLRPVFESIRSVHARFLPVSAWKAGDPAQIVVLDRFAPPQPPVSSAIWIDPPPAASPIPVRETAGNTHLRRWRSDHPVGAGLRTRDLDLGKSLVFRLGDGDIPVAETDAGPVIVARAGPPKQIVLGFHPVTSEMRYELATPLLFANAVRWIAPLAFRRQELSAASVGSTHVELETAADPNTITVSGTGQPIPWTLEGRDLRFFTAEPGVVHVGTPDRDLVFSLTLPSPGDLVWAPRNAVYGLPSSPLPVPAPREIWYWLALLGGAGLIAEWLLYSGARRPVPRMQRTEPASPPEWRKAS